MEIELNYALVGVRLRAARKKIGYTQEKVAELAGISAQHCSGVECGNAKVSLPALINLCNALDTTPNDILMDSISHPTPQLTGRVAAVFSECSTDETHLMLAQAECLKKGLREKYTKNTPPDSA